MNVPDLNLDRVSLDDFTVRRLSATLHFGSGDHPETHDSPYWIYLGCQSIPGHFDVGPRIVRLQASTVSGRSVRADVRVVARRDDAYGTTLILAGLEPLTDQTI